MEKVLIKTQCKTDQPQRGGRAIGRVYTYIHLSIDLSIVRSYSSSRLVRPARAYGSNPTNSVSSMVLRHIATTDDTDTLHHALPPSFLPSVRPSLQFCQHRESLKRVVAQDVREIEAIVVTVLIGRDLQFLQAGAAGSERAGAKAGGVGEAGAQAARTKSRVEWSGVEWNLIVDFASHRLTRSSRVVCTRCCQANKSRRPAPPPAPPPLSSSSSSSSSLLATITITTTTTTCTCTCTCTCAPQLSALPTPSHTHTHHASHRPTSHGHTMCAPQNRQPRCVRQVRGEGRMHARMAMRSRCNIPTRTPPDHMPMSRAAQSVDCGFNQ